MHIGIDIGSFKTVMYTTANRGAVISDKYGNRETPTVLELTKPTRGFGKEASSDSPANIAVRHRNFMANIADPESRKHFFMFLEYLAKIANAGSSAVALAIPEWFSEKERRILQDIVTASSLNVKCFLTQLTSAACMAFYESFLPKNFIIVDFGHHKTSLGLFSYENCKLLPRKRFSLKRGGIDFDEAITDLIMERHGLQPSPTIRERIFCVVEKIKKGLNTLEDSRAVMFDDNYDRIEVGVKKSEFLERVAPCVGEIQQFIDSCFEIPEIQAAKECIEVVGNNSNSALVTTVMEKYPFKRRMQRFDLVARGACTGLAVNDRKLDYHVDEICGRSVALRVAEEGSEPVVVIGPETVVNKQVGVLYHRNADFTLEVYDDGEMIGTIDIQVPESSNSDSEHPAKEQTVKVTITVGKFNTIEVRSVILRRTEEDTIPLEFNYKLFNLSKEELSEIVETETAFSRSEEEYRRAGELRNNTETLIYELTDSIDKVFPGILQDEDRELIETVMDKYLDDNSCGTYEQELEAKQEMLNSLKQVSDKLSAVEEELKNSARELMERVEPHRGTGRTWTEEQRKFMKISASLEGFIKNTHITLENVSSFDGTRLEKLRTELENCEMMQKLKEAEEARMAAKREEAMKEKENDATEAAEPEKEHVEPEEDEVL